MSSESEHRRAETQERGFRNHLASIVLLGDLLATMSVAGIAVFFFSMSLRNFALITLVTFGLSLMVVFLMIQPMAENSPPL